MIYKAQKGQSVYGEYLGIILMDIFMPFPPGCPGNATTFSFPVKYKVVKGATMHHLVYQKDPSLAHLFLEAGRQLVAEGVRAITGNCGFMILYQDELAAALPVPVFMSSLLQLPFLAKMLRTADKIGIITTNSQTLTPEMIKAATGGLRIPIRIAGMENQPHFYEVVHEEKGVLDFQKLQNEVVEVSLNLVQQDPAIKAILLECTDLPPFAAAIQNAVDLPVFDFTTMVDFVFSGHVRKPFKGLY